jgi:hypothetical protein
MLLLLKAFISFYLFNMFIHIGAMPRPARARGLFVNPLIPFERSSHSVMNDPVIPLTLFNFFIKIAVRY